MSTASDLAVSAKAFAFNDQTEISAVIYELASQAGLLSMTPSELAAASKCYCFNEGTARSVIAYLLAVKAGLQTTKPSDLATLAKCFCFDLDTWKKVVVYLLEAGGGGGTVQDMQVAWTPTNLKLGEMISLTSTTAPANQLAGITTLTFSQSTTAAIDIEEAPDLVSVSFPNLTTIPATAYLQVGPGSPLLASVSLPVIGDATGGISIVGPSLITSLNLSTMTNTNNVNFFNNPNLVNISLTNWVPQNVNGVNTFAGCALNAQTVNQILARCVANAAFATGSVIITGGTNAAPSGQGIADKATLIGRGVTVNTN